jgi:uncharacterized protein (DUF983 family)
MQAMPPTIPVRWSSGSHTAQQLRAAAWHKPGAVTAMRRGFMGRCPCCGGSNLFTGWLRPVPQCASCHAPLGRVRADDAPPYFVIFLVAHVVIGLQVFLDTRLALSALAEAAIFMPLALAMCVGLLRPVKGATIGLMLQLGLVEPAAGEPGAGLQPPALEYVAPPLASRANA